MWHRGRTTLISLRNINTKTPIAVARKAQQFSAPDDGLVGRNIYSDEFEKD
jgi:hypothetical protein